jgi:hypothetical protein
LVHRKIEPLPVNRVYPVPADIAIARSQRGKMITDLAPSIGILPEEYMAYGPYSGKIDISILNRLSMLKSGKYIVVTGVTPTPLGEGKSTTAIGLASAFYSGLGKCDSGLLSWSWSSVGSQSSQINKRLLASDRDHWVLRLVLREEHQEEDTLRLYLRT